MSFESDSQLVLAVRRGSPEAAAELFERLWPDVWRAAVAITSDRSSADDVAQESMLKILRSLEHYDLERPLAPWAHRIAVNTALDWLRSERRQRTLATRAPRPEQTDGPLLMEGTHAAGLWDAVQQLRDDRRLVVVLRYWLGYEPTEIAAVLGVPVGTVYSRLSRALDALRTAEVTREV